MNITVNGVPRSIDVKPDTPLLYVLRNDLGLVGARFGCGSGQCGACFVLLDGRPMASCDMPASFAEGKKVTTVEGLGNGRLHAVQQALIDEQAGQCGYCMSGIAVSAVSLLSTNAKPTEAEIRLALDKHLCRCGSHNRVVRAVMKAAARE